MKRAIACLLACLTFFAGKASDETQQLIDINGYLRFDYQHLSTDGNTNEPATGFKGKYFLLRVDGRICENLTYSWRQRINKSAYDSSFWDGTDWAYIDYHPGRWSFQAGKQIVQIGGYEYDRNPADVFGPSLFWNGIGCFQLGASAGYNITDRDNVTFQVTQSPFHTPENRNMYSYNLIWAAHHGIFHPRWAVNMVEYTKNHYISYIGLGNRFEVERWALELDLFNRAASHQTFIGRDATVIGNLMFSPTPRWTIFGKMSYDVNRTHRDCDLIVLPSTEMKIAGGGVEFYPLLKARHSLRLHLNCFYAWGKNTNPAEDMQNKTLMIDCGVSFKIDIFKKNH